MPVHGTLSRKLRRDVQIQINDGPVLADATFFLNESFIRITESRDGKIVNSYIDWAGVSCVRTLSGGG